MAREQSFAGQLVAGLGAGTVLFEVELVLKGHVSAHLMGDDVDECALVAVAKWPAGGLNRLDLTSHGFGDEETDGDCFKDRVRDAVRLPLAVNLEKAEGHHRAWPVRATLDEDFRSSSG